MRWMKPNTLYHEFDVSASTVLKLVKDGVLVEGIHYKIFPFGRRYNAKEFEKLNSREDKYENVINDLLQ